MRYLACIPSVHIEDLVTIEAELGDFMVQNNMIFDVRRGLVRQTKPQRVGQSSTYMASTLREAERIPIGMLPHLLVSNRLYAYLS